MPSFAASAVRSTDPRVGASARIVATTRLAIAITTRTTTGTGTTGGAGCDGEK